MLSIRFSRTGKKKQPYFRVILTEKQKDPWGKYIELLGNYNPRSKETNLKTDRIKYWLSVGAQATTSIHNLLVKVGAIEGKKKNPVRVSKVRKVKLDAKKKETSDALAKTEKDALDAKAKAEQDAQDAKAAAEAPQESTEQVSPVVEEKADEPVVTA
ncbi:MAG: 30S ribosomal protein S16 [Patescibacteria group bacterium]|jgi:small subunit ribosomal protein S16